MHALRIVVAVVWIAFWVYCSVAAFGAKASTSGLRRVPFSSLAVVSVLMSVGVLHDGSLVRSPLLGTIGDVLFTSGIALAIWARVHLGRNWGMPMTQGAEPELVTSGPYQFVRHPIYSGLLTALLGTALATILIGLILVAVLGGFFFVSASVEEKNLAATFPAEFPAYRTRTRTLLPFIL